MEYFDGRLSYVSQPQVIVDLFKQMCRNGFEASVTTVLNLLSAIGDLGSYLGGESLHGYCIKIGFCSDLHVLTALIDMYAKNGQIDLGRRIFDGVAGRMLYYGIVWWISMQNVAWYKKQ
ncbi:pentatricopeptide repeat-containing protein [Prunus yedoensis var. nudiflora]|uniref:Pentatricopeptide repeat-containing protein n=1 Tax=Prunus yedoensis var. nudiflora TaxID=2094558 RepID=A0A314ZQ77_PRUYE|nr:pentatricopeptide repeat-containing protein [Prunus yedoensis var. nudiflora]